MKKELHIKEKKGHRKLPWFRPTICVKVYMIIKISKTCLNDTNNMHKRACPSVKSGVAIQNIYYQH